MKIAVCLITLNEEANLDRCLRSCSDLADEIVVVDAGSTDATERIAREFGARWHVEPWRGFVAQKNLALSLADRPWVLSLDADEELSPGLRSEIRQVKAAGPGPATVGFSMPRCVWYEDRWIRHGDWYPDRLVRLFRRSCGRFEGGKVHERLEVTGGKIVPLRHDLYHYSFRDPADHWARCERYARLWAETHFEAGRGVWRGSWYAHAVFRWLRGYVLRMGFLDGRLGWRIAETNARETALKYRLLWEMRQGSRPGE